MTLPVPHPGYEHAGANRDIPKALPSSGMALRSALARAGAVNVDSAQALVDATLTDYYTSDEVDTAIAGIAPTAANTSASTAGWAGNLNGVTGDVQSALDAFDDATLGGTPADGSITLAKLADLAQDKLIGRATASTGVPEAIACTAAGRAILDDADAAAQRVTLGVPTDLVFTKVGANTAVNDTNDVTIVTQDITGVAAGDQVIVDAWFVILNNSTATRVYTITLDFDAAFDIEFATGACATSATLMHPFHVQAVCDIRASNLAYAVNQITGWTAAGVAAGGDVTIVATPLLASSWGTTTSDITGTLTVALKIRSANATATQTCRLHSFTVRKVTPT